MAKYVAPYQKREVTEKLGYKVQHLIKGNWEIVTLCMLAKLLCASANPGLIWMARV